MARILVVDDSATARLFSRRALEASGHTVTEAPSGDAALDALPSGFDLVLLDWNMPGMTGLEFAHMVRLTPQTQDALVVFATSENDERRRGYARQAGAAGFLLKPFSAAALVELVDGLLDRSGATDD